MPDSYILVFMLAHHLLHPCVPVLVIFSYKCVLHFIAVNGRLLLESSPPLHMPLVPSAMLGMTVFHATNGLKVSG